MAIPTISDPPFHPIIYVRGYAGTDAAVEETVATPYMGFNRGSTKARQDWHGSVQYRVFESPLIRLMKDHGYRDAYDADAGAAAPRAPARSIFIYRYYDEVSSAFGGGRRLEIEAYARGLSAYVLEVRRRVCGDDAALWQGFRVYLVAHSMGGLICRCFLQNARAGSDEARGLVDKVFTYASPHNGIDFEVLGNIPGFFSANNADNFNRARMAEYLDLPGEPERVNTLAGRFDAERFFCLVGTNDRDYTEAAGLARRLVGPMSDGLVRIDNAVVRGAPRAFVPRCHSGDFGIVNSEEGYQNLTRFLFGDVRVDGVLKVAALTLPAKVQTAFDAGRRIRASYHFEAVVRCRGATWDLHRRTVAEQSAVFRAFDEMFPREGGRARHPYLFSAFLSTRGRVTAKRPSLGFSLDLGVLVPEYEVDRVLWLDDHYDGGYLFRDKLNFELKPPPPGGAWGLRWGLDSRSPNRVTRRAEGQADEAGGGTVFSIPVRQNSRPGLDAVLDLRVRPWNEN